MGEPDSTCMGSSRLIRRSRNETADRWPRLGMAVLASVGAVDTGLITLKRWQIVPELACPVTGDGCDIAAQQPLGHCFGAALGIVWLSGLCRSRGSIGGTTSGAQAKPLATQSHDLATSYALVPSHGCVQP